MKNNKLYIINTIIIYIIILIPSLYTPMQSDDYSYLLKGISWDRTISHYTGWSGRIITDFTSSFLLKYLPYTLYEIINSFVFLLLCIIISLIPSVINRKKINNNTSSIILWLVFLGYWISNPHLGHTSFWIVGSINYLWPIMWGSIYFILLLYFINLKKEIKNYEYIYVVILGLLASCSNEATSVSIVLFTFIIFFIEHKKKIIITGFVSSTIGTLILMLAPGNRMRMKNHEDWYSKSIYDQIRIHIYERMPDALSRYLHLYLLIIVALIILILIKKRINHKPILYISIFFILSMFSNLVLVKAPYIMGRSLNTGLFFLLLILATIVYEYQDSKKILVKSSNSLLIGYSLIFFIPSYLYFTYMMKQANNQFQIRENIIKTAINNNKDSVVVPEWYFTKLLKDTDQFDRYQDGAIAEYYGIKNITNSPINFNYGIVNQENNKYQINKSLKENLKVLNIYNYTNDILDFSHKKELSIEFNESVKKYIQEGDTILFIHLYNKKDEFINFDTSIDNEIEINNKYYFNINLNNTKMSDISKIVIGLYNIETNKRSSELEISLN